MTLFEIILLTAILTFLTIIAIKMFKKEKVTPSTGNVTAYITDKDLDDKKSNDNPIADNEE